MYRVWILGMAVLGLILLSSCTPPAASIPGRLSPPTATTPDLTPQLNNYTYKIIHVYPHDREAFTEGLVFANGQLWEGTGLKGGSSIRRVDLATGEVLQSYRLPEWYFGEGITLYGDKLFQLTYTSNLGFVYNQSNFNLLSEFYYPTEGWGLTQDGEHLIMSDGSATLRYLDSNTLETTRLVTVRDQNQTVAGINELEYVQGQVYANIWPTNKIAIIELPQGRVAGWADLSGLLQTQSYTGKTDVLNGIAYDSSADRLFVTGKLWPFVFEIKLEAIK
jgi:glutaminyl-peptide cyclotransferase